MLSKIINNRNCEAHYVRRTTKKLNVRREREQKLANIDVELDHAVGETVMLDDA